MHDFTVFLRKSYQIASPHLVNVVFSASLCLQEAEASVFACVKNSFPDSTENVLDFFCKHFLTFLANDILLEEGNLLNQYDPINISEIYTAVMFYLTSLLPWREIYSQ